MSVTFYTTNHFWHHYPEFRFIPRRVSRCSRFSSAWLSDAFSGLSALCRFPSFWGLAFAPPASVFLPHPCPVPVVSGLGETSAAVPSGLRWLSGPSRSPFRPEPAVRHVSANKNHPCRCVSDRGEIVRPELVGQLLRPLLSVRRSAHSATSPFDCLRELIVR